MVKCSEGGETTKAEVYFTLEYFCFCCAAGWAVSAGDVVGIAIKLLGEGTHPVVKLVCTRVEITAEPLNGG